MKKLYAILLILCLLLSLAACGGGAEPDPNAGVYEAVSAELWGITVDLNEVFEDGFSLELRGGGKAVFHYEGKNYNMKWTLDGETFHAEGGGAELDGTLSGGVMLLEDVLESGMNITLICEELGGSAALEKAAEAEPAENARAEWWSGKWYGWTVVYRGGGIFAENQDSAWDVCADISFTGDQANIVIDTVDPEMDFTPGQVTLRWEAGAGEHGRLVSVSGNYLGFEEVKEGEWVIDPADSEVSSLEDMLCIYGEYEEDEDGDWLTYYIFLRPWGVTWDDVASADTSDMPYDDMMPIDYADWYLPQIGG